MKGIITGISTLIKTIKLLFNVIMNIFSTIAMVFRYLITIVELAFNAIITLTPWIKSFCVITISISIAYILIGRNTGKSDK